MSNTTAEITVSPRHAVGKNAARQLRKSGLVPAVIYGRDVEPLPVAVEERALLEALPRGAWRSTPVRLVVREGDEEVRSVPSALVVGVQQNALTHQLYSVDFHAVSLEERVRVPVPVRTVGESPGVRRGGVIAQSVHELTVEARPGDIPEHLDVDISELGLHGSMKVRDLALPEGVRVIAPPEETLLTIAAPPKLNLPEEAAGEVAEAEEAETVRPQEEAA